MGVDERLRSLERRYRETGADEDLRRLTSEEVRAGIRSTSCIDPARVPCGCIPCRCIRGIEAAEFVSMRAERNEDTGRWRIYVTTDSGETKLLTERRFLLPAERLDEITLGRLGLLPGSIPAGSWVWPLRRNSFPSAPRRGRAFSPRSLRWQPNSETGRDTLSS